MVERLRRRDENYRFPRCATSCMSNQPSGQANDAGSLHPSTSMASSFGEMVAPPLLVMTISMLMAGIMFAQVYYYALNYSRDPIWVKFIAYTVCLLEVAHACVLLHIQYFYIVEASQGTIPKISWSTVVSVVLGVVAICLVQGFYIYRIWQLSHSRCATISLALLLFFRSAFGIATATLTFVYDDILVFVNNVPIKIVVNIGLALSVCIDIVTPAMFIYFLRLQESQVRRTKTLMRKLSFYTVNTGAIAVVFSAATLIAFNFDKSSLLFSGFVVALGQVYANTMMALLNARQRLKSPHSGAVHSIPLENMRHGNFVGSAAQTNIAIEISKETETATDGPNSAQDEKDQGATKIALYSLV